MLSIVYLTCNRCKELMTSILSCEEHIQMEHEYVIVDNASSDDIEGVIATLREKGLDINYLKQNSNKGVAEGRNIGYAAAKGEICYFIDDDATIYTDGYCIDEAYMYLHTHSDIFALGTDCWDTEKEKQLVGHPEKGFGFNQDCEILHYIGCSHFVKKDNSQIIYLYPSNLMYGAEELYFGLRVAGIGKCIKQYPNLKIIHSPSSNTRSSQKERSRNIYINSYVVKYYYLPPYLKPISTGLFILRLLKFEGIHLQRIIKDYHAAKQRIDLKYCHTMSIGKVVSLMSKFGIRYII